MLYSLLSGLCLILSALHRASAASVGTSLQKRDADFASVRTTMDRDHSGKGGDPKEKYFHESVFHPHYDGRFSEKVMDFEPQKKTMEMLVQTYLKTMNDLGIETWMAHGTLIGWWWNNKILPWDTDIDVQVTEPTMHFLAKYYNMTTYHFRSKRDPKGRDYLIEINPNFVKPDPSDKLNVIDARWIDTSTGLFIDVTTLRKSNERPGILACKDGHHYDEKDIFPLRDSFLEGMPVKVPYDYTNVLREEYGDKVMTQTTFNKFLWNETSLLWEPIQQV